MLIDLLLAELKRDVASFADPGTEVSIDNHTLRWTRSRAPMQATLIRTPGGFPNVVYSGREYSYQAFLASEALADLKDLAQSILTQTQPATNFQEAPARTNLSGEEQANGAGRLILDLSTDVSARPIASTRVLFVHGNAGSGKTSALVHLTRLQAERYLHGETPTLFLYLDAQGKGLVQLEDVMARALQDLRAKFTYHSVASLTRRHCVIPIVDGFDELIGPSSAREAFANLSIFMSQLDCEGVVITSSRSAFIDYKTLHERAAEIAAAQHLSYEIVPVEVLAWPAAAIVRYVRSRLPDTQSAVTRIESLLASPAAGLVKKPFYLSRICDIIEQGGDVDESQDIARQVVQAGLAREAAKLRDQRGKELLQPEQHRALCEEFADEMWAQGTAELSCDTVRVLAELFADQIGLGAKDTKTLVDRSIAHGLLVAVRSGAEEKRAFEHELFRFEFQAGSLAKTMDEGQALRSYLYRGEIPREVVDRVPLYRTFEGQRVKEIVGQLGEVARTAHRNQYASSNGGSLAAALLRNRTDLPMGVNMAYLYLRSVDDLGACALRNALVQHSFLVSRL